MIDAVIFDFDGTLADTSELIINSFQTVYKKFLGEEKPVDYIRESFGEPLKITIEREFSQPFEEVFEEYRNYQSGRFNTDVKLFDKAVENLQYLKSKNIKTAIVTARMKESTLDAIKDFNIDKYFDVVVSINDTVNHKPHPEPLLKAINMLNTTPSQTFYVGDSKFDMECANRAGAIAVLAGWHVGAELLKDQYNVKYLINSLYDITKLI